MGIFWSKYNKALVMAEVLNLSIDPKVTFADVLPEFQIELLKLSPSNRKEMFAAIKKFKMLNFLHKRIATWAIVDSIEIRDRTTKLFHKHIAAKVFSTIVKLIAFAGTKRIDMTRATPWPKDPSKPQNGVIGRLRFSVVETEDIMPIFTFQKDSRFGELKRMILQQVKMIPEGKSGTFEPQNKNLSKADAKSIVVNVNQMLAKQEVNFTLRYSESQNLFGLLAYQRKKIKENGHAKK